MEKKGKLLLIIPCVPYPLNSGGNQAFYTMADRMRKEYDVSLLLSIRPDKELKQVDALKTLWPDVTFYTHYQVEEQKIQKKKWFYTALAWMNKFSSRKLKKLYRSEDLIRYKSMLFHSCFEPFSTDFTDFVYEVSRKGFDVIQVEFFDFLPLVYLFPAGPKKVFVHHELRYIRNEGELALFKQITSTDQLIFQVAKEYECAALSNYDHILALTEIDAKLLSSVVNPRVSITVSPAAILKDCTDVVGKFKPATNRLTFVGSEHHFPNQDAVIWFCNEIVPQLRKMNFPFVIELIGQWKKRYVLPYIGNVPELKIVGFVEDLDEALRGSISIVPIRIGSGMRMKILDTITSPAPLVTTTKGVEGIDLRTGIDCLVADTPQEFAKCIVKLCQKEDLQKDLVVNAFQRLQRMYVPQEMIEKRCNFYDELMGDISATNKSSSL